MDYATTKAGIVAFSKALAKQQIAKGIRVNARVARAHSGRPCSRPAASRRRTSKSSAPRCRWAVRATRGTRAPVYVFLASQEASYVTGRSSGATAATAPPERSQLRLRRPGAAGAREALASDGMSMEWGSPGVGRPRVRMPAV